MINHQYKCIFIHVPRTAGSSIEEWIGGVDWWLFEPQTKHLTASQAKTIYADYWDEYFKFSFVRHPVARVKSCLKYKEYFGLEADESGEISFDKYHEIFGRNVIVEYEHRFYSREEILRPQHKAKTIYGNILDEELDFIGKFENLESEINYLGARLGIKDAFFPHTEKSPSCSITTLKESTLEHIYNIYENDFKKFGYRL